MGLSVGPWLKPDLGEFPKAALVAEVLVAESPVDNCDALIQSVVPFLDIHAEGAEFVVTESGAEADPQPSFAEMIDPTDLLGQPQRMVKGADGDSVCEAYPLRTLGYGGRIDGGHADESVFGKVVFGDPNAVVSVRLSEVGFPKSLIDDLAVRHALRVRQELKYADLHCALRGRGNLRGDRSGTAGALRSPRWCDLSGRLPVLRRSRNNARNFLRRHVGARRRRSGSPFRAAAGGPRRTLRTMR